MCQENYEEFVRILSRHQRQIWRFISTLVPLESDADDVMQETSLVLWKRWGSFREDGDFLSWAFGIARRQVLAYARKHRSSRRFLDESVLEIIAGFAEQKNRESARAEERRKTLQECIEKLGSKERKVVEARYLQASTTKAIAKDLEKPVSTIYSILSRARGQLTDCVRREIASVESGT